MSNLTIFKQQNAVATAQRGVSELTKSAASSVTTRRIQTNTNGTFKRLVNGEQIGDAVRGDIDVIIVHALPKVSRVFYAGAYDPNAKPTLPDCWSNNGDIPEAAAGNKQSTNCVSCPKNVVGSGSNGKGRACRYQRRIAVILPNDPTGEVYQFNVPAKSLFGKGNNDIYPYEAYCRYLVANNSAPDRVVTKIAYDLDAESMELNFTATRFITEDELELVQTAQQNPATRRLILTSVSAVDGAETESEEPRREKVVKSKPAPAQEEAAPADDEEEEVPAPKAKRTTKKETRPKVSGDLASKVNAWLDGDGDEEE